MAHVGRQPKKRPLELRSGSNLVIYSLTSARMTMRWQRRHKGNCFSDTETNHAPRCSPVSVGITMAPTLPRRRDTGVVAQQRKPIPNFSVHTLGR